MCEVPSVQPVFFLGFKLRKIIREMADSDSEILETSSTSFTSNESSSMALQEGAEEKKEDFTDAAETHLTSFENLSLEDIQAKVDKMLQEDLQLKEKTRKNNMAMRKQWETIFKWQENVQKIQDSQKAKIEETRQYIAKLQLENVKMKVRLEKSQQREKALEEEMRKRSDDLEAASKKDSEEREVLLQIQNKLEAAQAMVRESIAEMELLRVAWKEDRTELKKDILKLGAALVEEKKKTAQKMPTQTPLQESVPEGESITRAAWMYERRKSQMNTVTLEAALNEERAKTAQLQTELDKERQKVVWLQNLLSQRPKLGSPPSKSLMKVQMQMIDLGLAKSNHTINDSESDLENFPKRDEVYKGYAYGMEDEDNQIAENLRALRRTCELISEKALGKTMCDVFFDGESACPLCKFDISS